MGEATYTWQSPCECRNTERNAYRYRKTKLWHCEQCDGVMPNQAALDRDHYRAALQAIADCKVAVHAVNDYDREALERQIALLREEVSERPQASIYLDVKGGKARLIFPDGSFKIVREGEAIRIWPHYHVRAEPFAASDENRRPEERR